MTDYPTHHILNDLTRRAFTALAQKAIPFMDPDAYFSDMLFDAQQAASWAGTKPLYVLVLAYGTYNALSIEEVLDLTDRVPYRRAIIKLEVDPDHRTARAEVVRVFDPIVFKSRRAAA